MKICSFFLFISLALCAQTVYLSPQLSVNEGGEAVLIWESSSIAGRVIIQAAMFNGTWGDPASLSPSNSDSLYAHAALNQSGEALGIWQNSMPGFGFRIEARTGSIGEGGWGGAIQTISEPSNSLFPEIGIGANGNGVAIWQQKDAIQLYRVYSATYSAMDETWTMPIPLNEGSLVLSQPYLAVNPITADAVAIWQSWNGLSYQIQAIFLPFSSDPGPVVSLSGQLANANNPQIAINTSDNAIASWHVADGQNLRIQAVFLPSGSIWGDLDTFLLSDSGIKSVNSQVAINNDGDGLIVWQSQTSSGYKVQTVSYSTLTGWGEPLDITDDVRAIQNPQVALNGEGKAVSVWNLTNEMGNKEAYASVRTAMGNWSSPQLISGQNINSTNLQVGMDAEGNAIASWLTSNSIQAAHYSDASGTWSEPIVVAP